MSRTHALECYRGDCSCQDKGRFTHPTPNAEAFSPPFTYHNWRTGKDEPLEVWRKASDEAPHCSKRCAKAESKKGHLSSCRRLRALVDAGWMPPGVIKRRAPWGSRSRLRSALAIEDPGCGLGECQRQGQHVPSCPLWRRPSASKGGPQ